MNGAAVAGVRTRIEGVLANAWVLAVLSGFVFLAIFQWRYGGINPEFFEYRDDGIITLSHARNWVDYGFIGVNPSGERLEATSAPLQLLLYAVAYGIARLDFQTFMSLQTVACTFGMGCVFPLFFRERPLFALGASAAAAVLLTQLSSFMIWHASGMENPLTHVFLLWTVWVLYRFARDGAIDIRWVVVPFLASIVRIDSIFHVGPVVAVFVLWWEAEHKDRRAFRFLVLLLALWAGFNFLRYLYFGALLPNTAVAQGISIGDRMFELLALNPIFLDQSFGFARTIFSRQGGYLLLLALPFLVLRQRSGPNVLLLAMAGVLVLTALAAPFVFGRARLDVTRTTTHMALFVMLAIAAAAYQWERRPADRFVLPIVAVLVFLIHEYSFTYPYNACCSGKSFDFTRVGFEKLAREHGIARPTVANPDLGIVSWHKQFNVVDLGLLGSSLVARLPPGPAFNKYFLEHAAPDLVETHQFWTCRVSSLFMDPRFRASYVFVGEGASTMACKDAPATPTGFWMRRDVMKGSGSRERALMDDLSKAPVVERVAAEMARCGTDCAYVSRSVYRALPEFRKQGDVARLAKLFENSPTKEFDLYLIEGADDARAWRKALQYLSP